MTRNEYKGNYGFEHKGTNGMSRTMEAKLSAYKWIGSSLSFMRVGLFSVVTFKMMTGELECVAGREYDSLVGQVAKTSEFYNRSKNDRLSQLNVIEKHIDFLCHPFAKELRAAIDEERASFA